MHADSEVIVAFLSLMSGRDTYDSLEKAENLLSARRSTVLGVRELLSVSPAATPASVDLGWLKPWSQVWLA